MHSRTHTHTNTYKPHKAKDRSRLRFWINVHVVNPLRVSQVLDGSHPTGRGAHCYRILLQNQHTLPGSLFTSLSLSLPLSPSLPPSLLGGDEDHDFDIQRNMGTILIARRLDAARRSNYNLTVSVTDGHHTATTQVHTRTTTLTHTHTHAHRSLRLHSLRFEKLFLSVGRHQLQYTFTVPLQPPSLTWFCSTPQAYIRVIDMNQHRPAFLKSLYEVRRAAGHVTECDRTS